MAKRLFDITFVILTAWLWLPMLAATALAVLLIDGRPIFFLQNRAGKGGVPFNVLKFKTMVASDGGEPVATGLGQWLRKLSLDEVPQMINVLKGDMSIVGPRPLVDGELESHGGNALYWQAKPGITGWWACHGRSNVDYHERLEMEYYYVRHLSLWLDLVCVCKTIVAVLWQKGAK